MEPTEEASLQLVYARADDSAWTAVLDHLRAQHRRFQGDANDACEKLTLVQEMLDRVIKERAKLLDRRQVILVLHRSQAEQARTDTQ